MGYVRSNLRTGYTVGSYSFLFNGFIKKNHSQADKWVCIKRATPLFGTGIQVFNGTQYAKDLYVVRKNPLISDILQ